jgi:predicted metal-dependent peptidase
MNSKLALARLHAMKKMPYMSATLYLLSPVEARGLKTLGVTRDARLLYDPEFCDELSDAALGGVLLHECMHLLQNHFDRGNAKGALDEARTRLVWNVAADCEINDDLIEAGLELPSEGKYRAVTPRGLGLPSFDIAESYYDKLMEEGLPDNIAPQCGSCVGNPLETEGEVTSGSAARTKEEIEEARKETASAIRAYKGKVSSGLERLAEEIQAPPKLDWRRVFAGRVRRLMGQRYGLVDFSYSRPPRRRSAVDIVTPAMIAPQPRIGILVDTSGSMSETELGLGLGQIRHVLRASVAEVWLATCDAELHALKRIGRLGDVRAALKGGGGTDLRPAFQALNAIHCDVIIAISDCCAVFPAVPPRTPTIWLRCGLSKEDPPFGSVVDID